MKTKKVYDIMIAEGENKGCYRQMGIESKSLAEELKEKYWEPSCQIVEREVEGCSIDFDELFD